MYSAVPVLRSGTKIYRHGTSPPRASRVGDYYVGGLDKPIYNFTRAVLLEVTADISFATVEVEIRAGMLAGRRLPAEPAHEIAFRALQLDDLRPVTSS
jgi:hypothetical protein